MATQVEFDYVVERRGTSINALAAIMAAVPLPLDAVTVLGMQLSSDTIVKSASKVTRRVIFSFGPSSDAVVDGVTFDQYGGIQAVAVGANGGTYGAAPIVTTIEDPTGDRGIFRSTLVVTNTQVVQGGAGYTAPTVRFAGGLVPPQIDPNTGMFPESCLQELSVTSPGLGYSSNAKLSFQGTLATDGRYPAGTLMLDSFGRVVGVQITDAGKGMLSNPTVFVWDPGPSGTGEGGGTGASFGLMMGVGTPALGTVGIGGGGVTSVTVTAGGGPYVMPPEVLISDAVGSGAVVTALMGVGTIDVINPGTGYPSSVTFSIVAIADAQTLDGVALSNMFSLFKVAIQQAVLSPVVEDGPILS